MASRGLCCVISSLIAFASAFADERHIDPISVGVIGTGPLGGTSSFDLSGDARFSVFASSAPDLVPNDTNGLSDVFLVDRSSGSIVRVNVNSSGEIANGASSSARISSDGRFIAFASEATNLDPAATVPMKRIYIRDLAAGVTKLVSKNAIGESANSSCQNPSISADGLVVCFDTASTNLSSFDANSFLDVYAYNALTGEIALVSANLAGFAGNGPSSKAEVSGDGSKVAFQSQASDLIASDTNLTQDVFIRDLASSSTKNICYRANGKQALDSSSNAHISYNGSRVALSSSDNLTEDDTSPYLDAYLVDTTTGQVVLVAGYTFGGSTASDISADGRFVAFGTSDSLVADDQNGKGDVYVFDVAFDSLEVASRASDGSLGNENSTSGVLSHDGRLVALSSEATNFDPPKKSLVSDWYVRDMASSTTKRIFSTTIEAMGNARSTDLAITDNGSTVLFMSEATNLVLGDRNRLADAFVRKNNVPISLANISPSGIQSNGNTSWPAISANGNYAYFVCGADNLDGDPDYYEIYRKELSTGSVRRIIAGMNGDAPNGTSVAPAVSGDDRYIAFSSSATNLVDGDTNGHTDVFVRDTLRGANELISVAPTGIQGDKGSSVPSISRDGRFVAFLTSSPSFDGSTSSYANVYVRDRLVRTTEKVSIGLNSALINGTCLWAMLSGDGRFVAYCSFASNLVPGDTNSVRDVFVFDRVNRTTVRANVSDAGIQADRSSSFPVISVDGRYVAFESDATNLVSDDTNGQRDLFLRDLATHQTVRIATNATSSGDANDFWPAISADGRFIAFRSRDKLSQPAKLTNSQDVFRAEVKVSGARLEGKLNLPELIGPRQPPVFDFTLIPVQSGKPINLSSVVLDGHRTYSRTVLATGEYWVAVKGGTFLRAISAQPILLTDGARITVDFDLVNGDCDGDDTVSLFDYLILSDAFSTTAGHPDYDPRSDLDGSLTVDLGDYLVLSANFDRTGD